MSSHISLQASIKSFNVLCMNFDISIRPSKVTGNRIYKILRMIHHLMVSSISLSKSLADHLSDSNKGQLGCTKLLITKSLFYLLPNHKSTFISFSIYCSSRRKLILLFLIMTATNMIFIFEHLSLVEFHWCSPSYTLLSFHHSNWYIMSVMKSFLYYTGFGYKPSLLSYS